MDESEIGTRHGVIIYNMQKLLRVGKDTNTTIEKMSKTQRDNPNSQHIEKVGKFTSGLGNADHYFIPMRLAKIRKPWTYCSVGCRRNDFFKS